MGGRRLSPIFVKELEWTSKKIFKYEKSTYVNIFGPDQKIYWKTKIIILIFLLTFRKNQRIDRSFFLFFLLKKLRIDRSFFFFFLFSSQKSGSCLSIFGLVLTNTSHTEYQSYKSNTCICTTAGPNNIETHILRPPVHL